MRDIAALILIALYMMNANLAVKRSVIIPEDRKDLIYFLDCCVAGLLIGIIASDAHSFFFPGN